MVHRPADTHLPAYARVSGALTGPGGLGDGSVPGLMFKLWPVVVHVDHADEDVHGVLRRVGVQVLYVGPQLKPENKPMGGGQSHPGVCLHIFQERTTRGLIFRLPL